MEPVRVGLIGYGYWAESSFTPAVELHGGARVVAAAARSKASQARIASRLGPDVTICNNAKELLNGPELDAVIVGVPIAMGAEVLAEVFDASAPALYEPPLAPNRKELPGMIDRLKNARALTQADLEFRFLPTVVRARELVREGQIGDVEFITARFRLPGGDPAFPITQGHPLWDLDLTMASILGTYGGDVLHRIVGSHPKRVMLLDGHACPKRMQWNCIAHYDYGNGVMGTLDLNHNTTISGMSVTVDIAGSNGNILLEGLSGALDVQIGEGSEPIHEEWPPLTPVAAMGGMRECVNAFLDAVASGGESPVGPGEVVKLQEIALAMETAKDSSAWEDVVYS